ncbi:MAG: hypothetical protein RRY79_01395 [Clostridia bacterium]
MNVTIIIGAFMLFAGIYLLVAAIRKKGRIFENEFIKEGKKELFLKVMRTLCFILAPIFLAFCVCSVLSYIEQYKWAKELFSVFAFHKIFALPSTLYETIKYPQTVLTIASNVLWYISLGGVLGMFIFNMLMTDRQKKNAPPQAKRPEGTSNIDPRFDFGEDSEKVEIVDKPYDPRFDFNDTDGDKSGK